MKAVDCVESADGSRKYVLALADGNTIEAVRLVDGNAVRYCVSSQVGCVNKCRFCRTGTLPYVRDLAATEIVGQVEILARESGEAPAAARVLFMGIGEPLFNVRNVKEAIARLHRDMAVERFTVCTSGVAPAMRGLFDGELPPVRLIVSVNAPDGAVRGRIMPIEKSYPLDEVIRECEYISNVIGAQVTLEYLVLGGVNDERRHFEGFAALTERIRRRKVQILEMNEWEEIPFARPRRESLESLHALLEERGVPVSMVTSLGREIGAGCGQLFAGVPHRMSP